MRKFSLVKNRILGAHDAEQEIEAKIAPIPAALLQDLANCKIVVRNLRYTSAGMLSIRQDGLKK
jgi:hypothetical protein